MCFFHNIRIQEKNDQKTIKGSPQMTLPDAFLHAMMYDVYTKSACNILNVQLLTCISSFIDTQLSSSGSML